MPITALLLDFDGLLIDSETAGLRSWRELYQRHGAELDLDYWLAEISAGRGPCMPVAQLEAALGKTLDWDILEPARKARRDDLIVMRPGAQEFLIQARKLQLRLALVSNAPDWWLNDQMQRVELAPSWFELILSKDPAVRSKPAPDSYLAALKRLGIGPDDALAFEDSPAGVTAAISAGIRTVAIPNEVTAQLSLGHAHLKLERLDSYPLTELLRLISGTPGG